MFRGHAENDTFFIAHTNCPKYSTTCEIFLRCSSNGHKLCLGIYVIGDDSDMLLVMYMDDNEKMDTVRSIRSLHHFNRFSVDVRSQRNRHYDRVYLICCAGKFNARKITSRIVAY